MTPPERLSTRDRVGFTALGVGMFMALLDVQIVASSLGELRAGLSASADEISWVQTSYLIGEVIMIPLTGFLSRLLSTRILFALSATGFTLASIACALATTLDGMIAARAVQGFLGGAMVPSLFVAIFVLFPPERRGRAMVGVSLLGTLAPTVGPSLGGWITEAASWHWLFLINVVPGPLVAVAALLCVRWDKPDPSLARGFDLPGLLLLAVGLGCLQYVLEDGAKHDWFEDAGILRTTLVAGLCLTLFVARVVSYGNPIVSLAAFRDRNFALGCGYSAMLGIGVFGSVFLLVLFLDLVGDYGTGQIGLIMGVTGLVQLAFAPVAAYVADKAKPRWLLAVGMLTFAASFQMTAGITAEWGLAELALPQALRGIAVSLVFPPVSALALGGLSGAALKDASGVFNLSRMLGGAVGIALLNALLLEAADRHGIRLSAALAVGNGPAAAALEALASRFEARGLADPERAALASLAALKQREALVLAFADCQRWMAAVLFVAAALVPLLRRPGSVEAVRASTGSA